MKKKPYFCPGYGSAAKFIATNVREMALDAEVYDKNAVTIVEVMGRDSGFLAAADAFGNIQMGGVGRYLEHLVKQDYKTD